MKIKCNNPATRSIGMKGKTASFDKDGYATVTKEFGKALAAAHPEHIEIVDETASSDNVEVVEEKATRKPKGA